MSTSKFRNACGKDRREKFTHCYISQVSSDGRLIAINSKFLALAWNVEGEIVVVDANTSCSARAQEFKIKGHKANVLDLEFSPFSSDILATSFDDTEILLYKVPEGGLKEDLTKEVQTYRNHKRKVPFINFNPVAYDVLCSGGFTGEIHVWSAIKGDSFVELKAEDTPSVLTWNPNGSLIGATTKNKAINIFDPRTEKLILKRQINDGIQAAKFAWTDNNTLAIASWDNIGQKVLRLWDIKKLDKEVSSIKIDASKTVSTVFADKESQLLFTVGKGEATTHVFEYSSGVLYKGLAYPTGEPSLIQVMQERKCVDYNNLEIDIFARLTTNKLIYYYSFFVPRKNPGFDPAFYPPMECGIPSLTFDQWSAGKNSEPVKKEIKEIDSKFVTNVQKFVKQEKPERIEKTEKLENMAPQNPEELVRYYENKIKDITKKIETLKEENENLKKKILGKKLKKRGDEVKNEEKIESYLEEKVEPKPPEVHESKDEEKEGDFSVEPDTTEEKSEEKKEEEKDADEQKDEEKEEKNEEKKEKNDELENKNEEKEEKKEKDKDEETKDKKVEKDESDSEEQREDAKSVD